MEKRLTFKIEIDSETGKVVKLSKEFDNLNSSVKIELIAILKLHIKEWINFLKELRICRI